MEIRVNIITSEFSVIGCINIPVNEEEVKDTPKEEILVDYLSKHRRKTDFVLLSNFLISDIKKDRVINPNSKRLAIRKDEIVAFSVRRDKV